MWENNKTSGGRFECGTKMILRTLDIQGTKSGKRNKHKFQDRRREKAKKINKTRIKIHFEETEKESLM